MRTNSLFTMVLLVFDILKNEKSYWLKQKILIHRIGKNLPNPVWPMKTILKWIIVEFSDLYVTIVSKMFISWPKIIHLVQKWSLSQFWKNFTILPKLSNICLTSQSFLDFDHKFSYLAKIKVFWSKMMILDNLIIYQS